MSCFLPFPIILASVSPAMNRQFTGDAGEGLIYAFYNYHSVPIPLNSIENLIRFVTSQLSITLIRFFFCCDVRLTPPEIVDCVQFLPGCEVAHFQYGSPNDLERSIANRMMKYADTDEKSFFALISDTGDYNILGSLGSRLTFFYPPDTDILSLARNSFELPKSLDIAGPTPTKKPVANGKMNKMIQELNDDLSKVIRQLDSFVLPLNTNIDETADESDYDTPNPLGVWAKGPPVAKITMDVPAKTITSESFKSSDANSHSLKDEDEESESVWNTSESPFAAPHPRDEPIVMEKKNPFASKFDRPNSFENANHFAMGEMVPQRENNPFDRPMSFVPQEKRNPFNAERPNPFEKPNPFQQSNASRGGPWRKEEPKTFGSLGRGQRNPFANSSPPPFGRSPRGGFSTNKMPDVNGPFRKPAQQCPHWEHKAHRNHDGCQLWHPHKECAFFPKCRVMAADCGYAHPFCADGECDCPPNQHDPQLNHYMAQ